MKFEDSEKLLRKSRGNYRINSANPFDWIGGTWFLTNKKMLFESNATNIKSQNEIIPLENIISIEIKYKDFLSSKLSLFLIDGSLVELHVKQRKDWISDIGDAYKVLKGVKNWNINSIVNIREHKKPRSWRIRSNIHLLLYAILTALFIYLLLELF